jgi:hypothetical protein
LNWSWSERARDCSAGIFAVECVRGGYLAIEEFDVHAGGDVEVQIVGAGHRRDHPHRLSVTIDIGRAALVAQGTDKLRIDARANDLASGGGLNVYERLDG